MKIFLYICMLNMMLSCQKDKDVHWSVANIDNTISVHPRILQMDEEELPRAYQNNVKISSTVRYSIKELDNSNYENIFKEYICTSYHSQNSDTLSIDIGIHSPFGGRGINICYVKEKFSITPYDYIDIILENEPVSTFEVLNQELTLNSSNYNEGDSLFGKIDFRIMETRGKLKVRHNAEGYFRTIVKR